MKPWAPAVSDAFSRSGDQPTARMWTLGWMTRMRRISATPPETSGRRGSMITTSGCCVTDDGDGVGNLAGAADDGEAVTDAEDPDHALARAVVGVDDEHAGADGGR